MADNDAIIGAAAAASQAMQALATGIGSKWQQERAYKYNMLMQHDAQNWNEMMFDKTNEYNSPVQQMARLSEAGLNPNLVYGQPSSGTSGAASSMSSPLNSTGSLSPVSFPIGEAISRAFETINTRHQSRLLDANAEAAHADSLAKIANASKTLAELPGTKAQSQMLSDRAAKYGAILELEMENTHTQNLVNRANEEYLKQMSSEVKYRYENLLPSQKAHFDATVAQGWEYVQQGWRNAESNRISANASSSSAAAANRNAAAYESRVAQENAVDEESWKRKHFENFLIRNGVHPDLANPTSRLMFSAQMFGLSKSYKDTKTINGQLYKKDPLIGSYFNGPHEVIKPGDLFKITHPSSDDWRKISHR